MISQKFYIWKFIANPFPPWAQMMPSMWDSFYFLDFTLNLLDLFNRTLKLCMFLHLRILLEYDFYSDSGTMYGIISKDPPSAPDQNINDLLCCEMITWIVSLWISQGGCGDWCVFCCQWLEPPSQHGGEFIFCCHVCICIARTEYVQNYINEENIKIWTVCKTISRLLNKYKEVVSLRLFSMRCPWKSFSGLILDLGTPIIQQKAWISSLNSDFEGDAARCLCTLTHTRDVKVQIQK